MHYVSSVFNSIVQINFGLKVKPNFGLKLWFKTEVKSKLRFKTRVYFCILIRF